MSRDKQIEEMTEHLVNIQHDFDDYCAKPCRECDLGGVFNCESYYRATELYDKGYRKASEVAREIFEEIEKLAFEVETYGHFYALEIGYGTFAELKKKYTEDGK